MNRVHSSCLLDGNDNADGGKNHTYRNIEKIEDIAHLISYVRKIWNISLLTIDDELVMIYSRWKDDKYRKIFTSPLQGLPAEAV